MTPASTRGANRRRSRSLFPVGPGFALRASLALTLFASVALPARAQVNRPSEFPFAVGAGGYYVTDTGKPSDVRSFSTVGFRIFGEVELESGIVLQARYENFLLPGSAVPAPPFGPAASSPRVMVNGGSLSVGYLFREAWWQAGIIAGAGVFGLSPRSPDAGEVAVDARETVVGWHAGLLTVFQISRRVDLRVEATGYFLQTDASHKPILLGAAVGYHF